jgi:c-di-GMP-binding flagellar brake protein YcgR
MVSACYFFTTKVKFCNANQAEFFIPTTLYKIQRRQHLRLTAAMNKNLWTEFKHPQQPSNTLVRRLENVSAGGAAIILNQEDIPFFPVGATIQNLTLSLDIQLRIEEATVLRWKEVATKEGTKFHLSVIFNKIHHVAQQALSTYVFNEISKYFTKIM